MELITYILTGLGLAGGAVGGYFYRRNIAEAKIGKAEDAVKQMIDDTQKRAEAAQRLAENRAALAEESERITRELEPQLSDLALDLVNHLQHWQDDRHSAVDAETIAAPYADIEHLTAGEHTNATTNRTK